MKYLNFSTRKFPRGSNGSQLLRYSKKSLQRAAIAAGRDPDGNENSVAANADIRMRLAALESSLDFSHRRLAPTSYYLSEGSTAKAQKTFLVGNALCAHAAYAHLDIPWIVDMERALNLHVFTRQPGRKRPDFIGRTISGDFYLFESKGRSSIPPNNAFRNWKRQVKTIKTIDGQRPKHGIVSAAYLNGNEWQLLWEDPPPLKFSSEIEFTNFGFFQAYYNELVKFILGSQNPIETSVGLLRLIPEVGVSVGSSYKVLTAFNNQDSESIIAFAREYSFGGVWSRDATVYKDGIIIKSGPRGKSRLKKQPLPNAFIPIDTPKTWNATPMPNVGQKERATQDSVVRLFSDPTRAYFLGYRNLGNWEKREGYEGKGNRNVEPGLVQAWLKKRGHSEAIIGKVVYELDKAAGDTSKSLYDRNKAFYSLLRYGVVVSPGTGQKKETIQVIDWKNPEQNDFGLAEEVTVAASNAKGHEKRPDLVIYINGIAVAVVELKRSSVSVAEGIRQCYDSQKKEFIEPFFSTVQLVKAGNDTEGLRYGTTGTKEKYFLKWKEERPDWKPGIELDQKHLTPEDYPGLSSPMDIALVQMCNKSRLLDLLHNFVVFDGGRKKALPS